MSLPNRGELSSIRQHTDRDDVNKVILPQGVQDGGDGVLGDSNPKPLHATTRVHQNHDVLGGGRGLNVPLEERHRSTGQNGSQKKM